jgi:hypothetical protein
MIEAGIFEPAAYAFQRQTQERDEYGKPVTVTDYAIIPKRLDKWFEENADEVRVYHERPRYYRGPIDPS